MEAEAKVTLDASGFEAGVQKVSRSSAEADRETRANFGRIGDSADRSFDKIKEGAERAMRATRDLARASTFYQTVFDAEIIRQSGVMAELNIAGSTLGIHNGGEGKRTWTGLSFQVADLFAACDLLRSSGGTVLRPPQDTPEESAHLAMCADSEGNEIMLTRAR